MNEDRKNRGWAFWATVTLAVALVGYPLSLGPACWWSFHRPLSFNWPRTGRVDVVSAEIITYDSRDIVYLDRRPGLMEVAFPKINSSLVASPVYSPIGRIGKHSPKPVQDALQWYLHLWVSSDAGVIDFSGF